MKSGGPGQHNLPQSLTGSAHVRGSGCGWREADLRHKVFAEQNEGKLRGELKERGVYTGAIGLQGGSLRFGGRYAKLM